MSIRDAIGNTILELARKDPSIVVLTADLAESLKVGQFKQELPKRFFDAGVAEQNMAGVAAGLALNDKVPFILSFAVFNPGLNLAMIRTIAYSNLNVKIVGGHAGLSNAGDGATHQALEDIASMRTLPNMTVLSPADDIQARWATEQAVKINGPVYIRSTRLDTPTLKHTQEFKLKQPELIPNDCHPKPPSKDKFISKSQQSNIQEGNREGCDVTLFSTGPIINTAIQVAKTLNQQKITTRVVNLHTLKPININAINQLITQTQKLVVSLEDHQVSGGLGGLLAEIISGLDQPHPPLLRLGVKDQFGQSARNTNKLYASYGLDETGVLQKIKEQLGS